MYCVRGTFCISSVQFDILFRYQIKIAFKRILKRILKRKSPPKKKSKGQKGQEKRIISSVQKGRCAFVTDKTMDPYNGQLRCRLNHMLNHWPVQVRSKHRNCQMHSWQYKIKHRSQLIHCPACNVTLCLDCYKPFHEMPNIDKRQARRTKGEVQRAAKF